jgi:hypothetical protein
MVPWEILTAPLAMLLLLALYRFIGCGLDVTGTGAVTPPSNPPPTIPGNATFDDLVTDFVASWKLGEGPGTGNGDTAADVKGAHPGIYTLVATSPQIASDSAPLPTTPLGTGPGAAPPGGFKAGIDGIIKLGTCVRFNGGFVRVFNPTSSTQAQLNPPDFSLVALVRPESAPPTGDNNSRAVITSRSFAANKRRGYMLSVGPNPDNPADPGYFWQASVGDGGNTWAHVVGPKVSFDQPAAVIVTYDQTQQQLLLWYFDSSIDVGKLPVASNKPVSYSPSDSLLNRPLFIAAGRTDQRDATEPPPVRAPNYWFLGLIQEVRIYNRALSTDEVVQLFTASAM